ncbi:MAG TPA: hypothetical protein H9894_08645 [Candidatus Desulfovibrio intestinipullorum]|uniref:Sel1 repeat family protein n=1 Tax=Candidatus Desulfovibrio intestinipullorum TaxID=2838536 RepID=A0A9D1PX74_9BACT|nr:hypothetical protein [Candidatus Desulfovibrio intestinipullorum]
MDVLVTQDPRYTANHALIVLSPCPHPGLNPFFTLQKGSDQTYLSADGRWLNTVERIPIQEVFFDNGTLRIPIDSTILQQLDTLESYRITVNDQEPCDMAMPNVLPAGILQVPTGALRICKHPPVHREQSTQTKLPADPQPQDQLAAPQPQEQTTDILQQQPIVTSQPQQPAEDSESQKQAANILPLKPILTPLTLNLEEKPQVRGKSSKESQKENSKPLTMTPGQDSQTDQPAQGRKGSKLFLILGIVVLCLIIGGLVWWFVLRDTDTTPAPEQTAQHAPLPAPMPEPKPKKLETPPPAGPFLDSAREHLRGSADPATSLSMAKARLTPDADAATTDGAFLLIEDAAQKGQPEAMYLLGQFYDPASTLPKGSIMPDAAQARDWYGKAAAAGFAKARTALKNLKNFLKARAGSGDAEAARLLETF